MEGEEECMGMGGVYHKGPPPIPTPPSPSPSPHLELGNIQVV